MSCLNISKRAALTCKLIWHISKANTITHFGWSVAFFCCCCRCCCILNREKKEDKRHVFSELLCVRAVAYICIDSFNDFNVQVAQWIPHRYRISLISITRKNIITFVAELDNSHLCVVYVCVLDWAERARADKLSTFNMNIHRERKWELL